ncbi:MAG: DUF433 domain-containing protein [Chitinophagaceae bacterium]
MSYAVKESLVALGKGFLQHEANASLREKLKNGSLTAKDFYRQLLRLIYRFLFLMVTEERDLVYNPDDKDEDVLRKKRIYLQFYSIARLRKLSENRYLYEKQFNDLWQGLIYTFQLFEAGGKGKKLSIQPLDGDLFNETAIQDIETSLISNELLLECIRNLNEFTDDNKSLVPINYRSLDVEELGSVYEGLLELYPVVENIEAPNPALINFTFHEGTERKTTGSYYTRPDLVNELIKSALIPVIEERLKVHSGDKEAQEKSLLALKVCDAAAGSGHMLLAAARTIAWYLARVQSSEDNPAPSVFRSCLREVIQHCVYGVDMNPDAVELCKLALWLESHNSGKPLSFLDHKIRCGNSLVGVTDLSILNKGIPDEAYTPVTGDDKEVCRQLKKANAAFNKTRQISLFDQQTTETETHEFSAEYHDLDSIRQDDVDSVHKAKNKFEKLRSNVKWWKDWRACNLWTSAFFLNYTDENKSAAPTSERLQKFLQNSEAAYGPMVGKANALAIEHKFFHWSLEFPDVFEQGGFDIMLGNPPWERIKLQEEEFFATKDVEIAKAPNASARKKLIANLPSSNPVLYRSYQSALHNADCLSKLIRFSNRFPLTAVGDINTYSIFAELYSKGINQHGRGGFIVPTGIATDDANKDFFGDLVEKNRLVSLFDFENTKRIFQAVHSGYKFSLLTISGTDIGVLKAQFGFYLIDIEQLKDSTRVFALSKDDFLRLNPNTKTCPVFRTRTDADLTTKIYKRIPVFVNEIENDNPWAMFIRQGLYHMTNDNNAGYIKAKNQNSFLEPIDLYEAKMMFSYDHHFANFIGNDFEYVAIKSPDLTSIGEYVVDKQDLRNRIEHLKWSRKWFFIYRNITKATQERTIIASIIPLHAPVFSCRILFSDKSSIDIGLLLGQFNSLVLDYIARQKVGGTNLSDYYTKQFPVLRPSAFSDLEKELGIPKILELTYFSWDIKVFADDIWKEADEVVKAAIKKQWEKNEASTGGCAWNPPSWCEIDETGCPLPPFKWDEDRRAILKAELDAIYAKLYGLTTEELRYILDPQDVYGSDFPGETFRVLKEKEIRQYGEYRTRRLVLEAWQRLNTSEKLRTDPQEPAIQQPISVDLNDISTAMKEWSLHDGIYNIQDCARITRLSADKIRRWFGELYKENYEGFGDQRKADVTKLTISFHGLIELVVIGTLREAKIKLKDILTAREKLKSFTKKEYPFATNNVSKNLKVAGKTITFNLQEGNVDLNGSDQFNFDFIKEFFRSIVFDGDIAMRMIPEKGKGKIVIDPKEANGKPAIINKEVPVDTILQFYRDKSSIKKIAQQFELTDEEVEAAVEYSN